MEEVKKRPKCYNCLYRRAIPGDCHSRCVNTAASVKGNEHGIKKGWFFWPYNFDPLWLDACDGYVAKEKN